VSARARPSGKVTQRDVARAAGVSHQSVSFILNGRDHLFKPETVAAVRRVAEELGYRRSAAARSMRAGAIGSMALVLLHHRTASTVPPRLLDGLCAELEATSRSLVVERWQAERLTEDQDLPRQLREVASDGLVINWTQALPEPAMRRIAAARIPHVLLNNPAPWHAVRPDDFAAARAATAELIAAGHRRIAYADWLHEPDKIFAGSDHYSIHDRWRGYAEVMTAAGLAPRALLHERVIMEEERRAPPLDWLRGPDAPTALVSYSDYGVAAALTTVPDLAVASFGDGGPDIDGLPVRRWQVPLAAIARAAVAAIDRQIEHPGEKLPAVLVGYR
jgi:LacI family transcriptional regulator